MDKDTFSFNNQIYSNNNNILLEIIDDLQQIVNSSQDNLMTKRIGDIIIKMNSLINENKKNMESIMKEFSSLKNQLKKLNEKLDINCHKKIEYEKIGNYVGPVVNGLPEGRGILYYDSGNKYEGDFKNGKREGKGIYYYKDGDRYEGDFKNGKKEGKGIYYYNKESFKGDRYEGDFRNNIQEGKGVYYYNNGDREMGDYSNGKRIGKCVILKRNGEVKIKNY